MIQTHSETVIKDTENSNKKDKYYCPMYCEADKTYDLPGDCPVCGMHLVKAGVETQQRNGTE